MPIRNHQYNGASKNIQKNGGNQCSAQTIAPSAWGGQNTIKKLGMVGNHVSGGGSGGGRKNNAEKSDQEYVRDVEDDEYGDILDDDDDDDDYDDDDDEDEIDHETLKKGFFKKFFKSLDDLTVEQINDPNRQWHCAACRGGQGAIDWYRGIQAVTIHCRKIRSRRVKLHMALAKILDDEIRVRGATIIQPGEMFGKWMNPCMSDKEIVWPPMVMIMNTRYQQEENGKWTGMGNQELLDYFFPYEPSKARHSYGPQGHRGMSVLVFEQSVVGYHNADRLSKDFEESGKGRDAWGRLSFAILPGGKRQLFGFMAERKDMENFNQHCQGNARLKFDMRLYQEVVVNKMRQMSEENQDLMFFKNKAAKERMQSKALEESFGIVSAHLKKTLKESKFARERTKMHHQQNKEEMDYQEKFFNDQLKVIYEAREASEENFEKIQQQERNIAAHSPLKDDEFEKYIKSQDGKIEEYIAKRETLIKSFGTKKLELKKRHCDEQIAMEKEYDGELAKLMEEYSSLRT